MEPCLVAPEAMSRTDRTRLARPASELEAIRSGGASEMTGAGLDIIALEGEGADRTRGETRLRRAAVAGTWALDALRQRHALGESERAAIAVPEAPIPVDQHAQRRAMHRLRLHGPALERQPGRALEGIERVGAERGRKPVDDAPRPAVERIWPTVGSFRRGCENRPLCPPDEAREHQRA